MNIGQIVEPFPKPLPENQPTLLSQSDVHVTDSHKVISIFTKSSVTSCSSVWDGFLPPEISVKISKLFGPPVDELI